MCDKHVNILKINKVMDVLSNLDKKKRCKSRLFSFFVKLFLITGQVVIIQVNHKLVVVVLDLVDCRATT